MKITKTKNYKATKAFQFLVILSITFLFSSCATIFSKRHQIISVTSSPPGARVYVNGQDTWHYTPCDIEVQRRQRATSENEKNQLVYLLKKEGYTDAKYIDEASFNPVMIWSILTVWVYGIPVVVDLASGAHLKYLKKINVQLREIPKSTKPDSKYEEPTANAYNINPEIPKPTKPAYLVVSDITFTDIRGNNNRLLDANENAEIKFTVLNKGQGNAYNLIASINEKNQIKGLEYSAKKVLGDLKAGDEITIAIPVSGEMNLEQGKAEFEISISEGNHFDADPFKVSFGTQSFKTPSINIADYKFTANEEGKIKLGQPVSLNVVIQNQGQGEASDVKVNFTNPQDVFPGNETFFDIGTLKPNESKTIVYEFFANKRYSGTTIPILIDISENYRKYGQNRTLSVSLEERLRQTQAVNVAGEYDKQIQINQVSLTADVDKNIPENASSDENAFALIIGNEDYRSYQSGISNEMNVAYAINDANIFKTYCRKTLGIPEKNISYLSNATSGRISQEIDRMNKLIKATNGKAKVIVYYAGHGLPDEVTKEPYLIPVDVSGTNIKSGIKLSYLYSKLTEFPAQQVTVFIDACFSGGGRTSGLLAARGVKVKPKDDYLKGNIVVFTASSGEESSLPYNEKQHGMFTYFLLKKLQDTKGEVSFSELSNYLKEKVELESVRTNSKHQSPQTLMSEDLRDNWGGLKLK
ncbi:MAG: caspase family protein [Bacteroidetes bacterium]|nr:caspase family protein [Bacteroidota bacterium]